MIIVQITSGLGNQLFQYAAAKALSIQLNTSLKLDLSYYEENDDRRFLLDKFNIISTKASPSEMDQLKGYRSNTIRAKIKRRLNFSGFEYYNKTHIKERTFHNFYPDIFKHRGDLYLEGYWINPNYFKGIETTLRSEYSLKDELEETNIRILNLIENTNSVSIHVRRGDFLNNNFFKLPELEYYRTAINIISERIHNSSLFIFSDDPEWCKIYFRSEKHRFTIITNNLDIGDHVDLFLMSKCKHNIISNSSFSWWGAWLNKTPKKIIIAPKLWYNNKQAQKSIESGDLLPNAWLI
ncbi:MAG: alpha-1,2-fucosyltransferase [Bacteroidales bacterium]|nr:alpha-1,2-fucosyltransferase [Bacteroidales bacterium]